MEQEQKKSINYKKYLYAFLVIAAAIVLFFVLMYMGQIINTFQSVVSVLSPILWGLVMAYVLNPVMKFLEKLFKKPFSKIQIIDKVNVQEVYFIQMCIGTAMRIKMKKEITTL